MEKRPLSAIIKEMAVAALRQPKAAPSSEAAHAALLFAHVAWNQAGPVGAPGADYRPMLRDFEASNPRLWNELKSSDAEAQGDTMRAWQVAVARAMESLTRSTAGSRPPAARYRGSLSGISATT